MPPLSLADRRKVSGLCQEVLAIILGGLPMVDFVLTLEDLLEGADTEVGTCLPRSDP